MTWWIKTEDQPRMSLGSVGTLDARKCSEKGSNSARRGPARSGTLRCRRDEPRDSPQFAAMTSDGTLPALNDASDDTTPPSAPPLTSCSAQTDFVDDGAERTSTTTTTNDEACQKFEAIMAVCAIVGLVAITCVFVVAGAFVGTKNSDSATIFQRRLETYKILRGVSES